MKKTLTAAALSSVLVLGMASAALAIHETQTAETATPAVAKGASKITIDGNVRERGVYENPESITKDEAGRSYYDSRVQLGVNAQVSDQATGYMKLETGTGNNDTQTWGSNSATTPTALTTGGDKLDAPTILEAWVNYNPGPVGVKAGHMPLALGNKVFFDHTGSGDDAIVVYGNIGEATHIAGLTIKFDENVNTVGTNNNSDDINGYVGLITHKLNDNVNLGANWTYLNGTINSVVPGLSMSNIGLTADGKIGAISYMADGEFQFGEFADAGTDATTMDANGFAVKLGADYDLGAGKIGLVYGYGSGKDTTDADYGTTHEDQDQFINFLTDTTYDTIIAGYRGAVPGAGGIGNTKNNGLSNLSLYQLKASTKVVCPLTAKDLSILGTVSYMQLNEDYTANTGKEDKVGTEVDLIATWKLTAGLDYKVEAAYLFVGDVYNTALNNNDPDDQMFLRHSLDLRF